MSSDNPSGADDQQERPSSCAWLDAIPLDVGFYVAGFVDGEGSFNVPIRRSRDRGLPWRVSLSFNVSQLGPESPRFLRDVFGVGTVRARGDGVYYFEVTRPDDLHNHVFPFFERFRSTWAEGSRPGGLRGDHGTGPVRYAPVARRHHQHPRPEGADEPRRQAATKR